MPSLSDLITLDCTHVGIDTIHLHTPSVPFDPDPSIWGPGGGTFIPNTSTRDPYPITSYDDPMQRFNVKVGAWFRIELTAPRILYPDNRNPLPLDQLQLISDFLQEQFDYLGLPIIPDDLYASRIDICKNYLCPIPPAPIIYMLSQITWLQRMVRTQSPETYRNPSVLWSNGQRELYIYDKGNEMRRRGLRLAGEYIRIEDRRMKPRSCRAAGFHSFQSLLEPENYLRTWHNMFESLMSRVRGMSEASRIVQSPRLLENFRSLTHSTRDFGLNLAAMSYDPFMSAVGGDGGLKSLLDKWNVASAPKKRLLDFLQDIRNIRYSFDHLDEVIDVVDLLEMWHAEVTQNHGST